PGERVLVVPDRGVELTARLGEEAAEARRGAEAPGAESHDHVGGVEGAGGRWTDPGASARLASALGPYEAEHGAPDRQRRKRTRERCTRLLELVEPPEVAEPHEQLRRGEL